MVGSEDEEERQRHSGWVSSIPAEPENDIQPAMFIRNLLARFVKAAAEPVEGQLPMPVG